MLAALDLDVGQDPGRFSMGLCIWSGVFTRDCSVLCISVVLDTMSCHDGEYPDAWICRWLKMPRVM